MWSVQRFSSSASEHASSQLAQVTVSLVKGISRLRTIFYEGVDTTGHVLVHFATNPWPVAAAELMLNTVPLQ